MMAAYRRSLVAAALSFGLTFAQSAVAGREWAVNPIIAQVDTSEDIFVIGDVHGDYSRAVKVLEAAKITDNKPDHPENIRWKAGKSVLVFVGDLIDKDDHSLKVIQLVMSLSKAANEAGGQVIALLGNHEAEFLANPQNEKVADFVKELKDADLSPEQVAACGTDVGAFLCNLPAAARVRDWFFAHAGNTSGLPMTDLISNLQQALERDGFGSEWLVGDNSLLESSLTDGSSDGANWFEADSSRTAAQVLSDNAAALGVAHIVQGHEPGDVRFSDKVKREAGSMFQRYGLLFLVDTGMSDGVKDSKGAVLRIRKRDVETAVAVCSDGNKTTLWDSDNRPDLGKADPCN